MGRKVVIKGLRVELGGQDVSHLIAHAGLAVVVGSGAVTAWQTWFERERVEHAILALTAKPEFPAAILSMVEEVAQQRAVTTCGSYEQAWRSLVTEATHRLMKGDTPESVVEWLGRSAEPEDRP